MNPPSAITRQAASRFAAGGIALAVAGLLVAGLPGADAAAPSGMAAEDLAPERQIRQEQSAPAWKMIWDEARRLAAAGNRKEAVDQYERLFTLRPDLAQARREYGGLLLHLGRYDAALVVFEALVEKNPDRPEFQAGLGKALHLKGNDSRALAIFKKIMQQRPDDTTVLAMTAKSLLRLDRQAEALEPLAAYCRLESRDEPMRWLLIETALALGERELARPYLAAFADRPDAGLETLEKAARLHQDLSRENDAAGFWRRVLLKNPAQIDGHRFLIAYLEKRGRDGEALPHYLALIEQGDRNPTLRRNIGALYLKKGDRDKALLFLEQYVGGRPDDRAAARDLAAAKSSAKDRSKILAGIEQDLFPEEPPDPESIRRTADLYRAGGQAREALPLYHRLLAASPDDPELLELVARDLAAVGDDAGALAIWRRLAGLIPDRLDVQLAMEALLERLGLPGELQLVREHIVRIDPANVRRQLELARVFLDRGRPGRALELAGRFAAFTLVDADLLVMRARLFEELGFHEKALADYRRLTALDSGSKQARLGVLRCAGRLGLLPQALESIAALGVDKDGGAALLLTSAEVLRQAGDSDKALRLYRKILQDPERKDFFVRKDLAAADREKAVLAVAGILAETSRPYEAEQVLRQFLAESGNDAWLLAALARLALDQNQPDEAMAWIEAGQRLAAADDAAGFDLRILEIRQKLVLGEKRAALRQAGLAADSLDRAAAGKEPEAGGIRSQRRDLARVMRDAGDYAEARRQAELALRDAVLPGDALAIRALLVSIHRLSGEAQASRREMELIARLIEADAGLALAFARQTFQDGLFETARETASGLVGRFPASLAAGLLVAESEAALGRPLDADRTFALMSERFGAPAQVNVRRISLLSDSGRFSEALALLESLPAERAGDPDLFFQKARVFWGLGRHDEALALYEKTQRPGLDEEYALRLEQEGLAIEPKAPKSRFGLFEFWSSDQEKSHLDRALAPRFATSGEDPRARAMSRHAAGFFAAHSWRKRAARELAARSAVRDQEYYRAARLYRELVGDYGASPSFSFDLAGIYSRLEMAGEEAALYQEIREKVPDYPGLEEAERRNRLQRRPTVTASYDFRSEEGYEGGKAIRDSRAGFAAAYSPKPRQIFDAAVERILFQSPDEASRKLRASRLFFGWQGGLLQGLSFEVGGGLLRRDIGSVNSTLLQAEIRGDLGDQLESRFSFRRDAVADTIDSLSANIVREELEAEVFVDVLPRLRLGGEYGVTDFSDGIVTEGYELDGVWTVISDPTLLQASYSYEFRDSRQASAPSLLFGGGVPGDSHPYWTPKNFWLNKFSLYFKHRLSSETFGREIPRYYTAMYSLGHDVDGHARQTLQGGLFAELGDNFVVQASADVTDSPAYRRRGMMLGLTCRW